MTVRGKRQADHLSGAITVLYKDFCDSQLPIGDSRCQAIVMHRLRKRLATADCGNGNLAILRSPITTPIAKRQLAIGNSLRH